MEAGRWMLKDLLLFALLPACCGALAVAATLVLPGGGDAASASPRALFSASLINGIAAFTLPGVIQVWFTMGETRRANRERERADLAEERLRQARERVRQLEAELWKASLAEIRARLAAVTMDAADLRRRLAERDAAAAAAAAAAAKAD